MSSSLESFNEVKEYARGFVVDRQWSKFHTPLNLVLALSGEAGELSEIFQWKGSIHIDNIDNCFSKEEIIHIGEEISDVFIYGIRLSDVCDINLAPIIIMRLKCGDITLADSADDIRFDYLSELLSKTTESNVRGCALQIQSQVGIICDKFSLLPDSNEAFLRMLSVDDQRQIEIALSNMFLLLVRISLCFKLDIGRCIEDKFKKNERKYPVNLVKGSSAKYTAYADVIKEQKDS